MNIRPPFLLPDQTFSEPRGSDRGSSLLRFKKSGRVRLFPPFVRVLSQLPAPIKPMPKQVCVVDVRGERIYDGRINPGTTPDDLKREFHLPEDHQLSSQPGAEPFPAETNLFLAVPDGAKLYSGGEVVVGTDDELPAGFTAVPWSTTPRFSLSARAFPLLSDTSTYTVAPLTDKILFLTFPLSAAGREPEPASGTKGTHRTDLTGVIPTGRRSKTTVSTNLPARANQPPLPLSATSSFAMAESNSPFHVPAPNDD